MTKNAEVAAYPSFCTATTKRRVSLKVSCLMIAFCLASSITSSAQTFTSLLSFDGPNGAFPFGSLVQGLDGNFYGTTPEGGATGNGSFFEITPQGVLTTLFSFCVNSPCTNGQQPEAGLVQSANGNFFGTTAAGGTFGYGTVFEVSAQGQLTNRWNFCSQLNCPDGSSPSTKLVQATNGRFYGTTPYGGTASNCSGSSGCGTLFEITASGILTTLYNFCSQPNCADGQYPHSGLIQAANGNLYGTTYVAGPNGGGTIFQITPGGKFTTIYSFCSQSGCTDGLNPRAELIQAANGNFYGTTFSGGAQNSGTVFELTPAGKLITLHSFCSQNGCADGEVPGAALIQASDGNFYGTTENGGNQNLGVLFEITFKGKFSRLYSFCAVNGCIDGYTPMAALVQSTNGILYGTTFYGGTANDGTVFSDALGLPAFVETLPTSGKAGTKVAIQGTGLNGATSVTFNGTPALFSVVSPTEIKTGVPPGATTGTVQVTTPGGTLNSDVVFRVIN